MPPLRDRREDIHDMARFFRDKFNARYGQNGELTESGLDRLLKYDWRGNVRQLRDVVDRLFFARGANRRCRFVERDRGFRRATVYADPITSRTVARFAPPAHISSMAEREPASLSAAIASVTTVTSPIFISARAA